MDRLDALFLHCTPRAEVFFTGTLCEATGVDDGAGHVHLLESGSMAVQLSDGDTWVVEEPSVVFLPRPIAHRITPGRAGAGLVCAKVRLGSGALDPLWRSMAKWHAIPLRDTPTLAPALRLLFDEAADHRCGRRVALDGLASYFLVLLLRHLMDSGHHHAGVLGALADARLAKALVAMHEKPGAAWTLERLAEQAGMSRARFAHHFRQAAGSTPLEYLTDWRLSVAQRLLQQGRSIKSISAAVGYHSPAALARAFNRRLGQTPSEWLAATSAGLSAQTRY